MQQQQDPPTLLPLYEEVSGKKKKKSSGGDGPLTPSTALRSVGESEPAGDAVTPGTALRSVVSKKQSKEQLRTLQEELTVSQFELILNKKRSASTQSNTGKSAIHTGYEPDCGGLSQTTNLFLSYAQARDDAKRTHPHEIVEGEIVLEKVWSFNTGWHTMRGRGCVAAVSWGTIMGVCWVIFVMLGAAVAAAAQDKDQAMGVAGMGALSCAGLTAMLVVVKWIEVIDRITGSGKEAQSKLYDYGVGVVLYFRWLKFLACLFFAISALSAPALYFYYAGTTFELDKLQSLEKLGAFTLGSIGEASPICFDRIIQTSATGTSSTPAPTPSGSLCPDDRHGVLVGTGMDCANLKSMLSCASDLNCATTQAYIQQNCHAIPPNMTVSNLCPETCNAPCPSPGNSTRNGKNGTDAAAAAIAVENLDYIPVSCKVGQIASLKVYYGNPTGFCGCHKAIKPASGTGTCEAPKVLDEIQGQSGVAFKYIWPSSFYKDYMPNPNEREMYESAVSNPGLNDTEMAICTSTKTPETCQAPPFNFRPKTKDFVTCTTEVTNVTLPIVERACKQLSSMIQSKKIARVLQPVLDRNPWTQGEEPVLQQYCCGPQAPPRYYHEPGPNSHCNSFTMQKIADFKCLGRSACNLTLDENKEQPIRNPEYDQLNLTWEYLSTQPHGPKVIYTTMADGLNYTKHAPALALQLGILPNESRPMGANLCSEDGMKRMMVLAKCYDPMLAIKNDDGTIRQSMPKETMAYIVIAMDCLGSALFLLMVAWLSSQEEAEVEKADASTITASDYSLFIRVMPKASRQKGGTQALAHSLKDHIEEDINSKGAKKRAIYRRGEHGEREAVVEQIHFGLNNFDLINLKKKRENLGFLEEKIERKIELVEGMHKDNKIKEKHYQKGVRKLRKTHHHIERRLHDLDLKMLRLMNKLDPDNAVEIKDVDPLLSAKSQAEIDEESGIMSPKSRLRLVKSAAGGLKGAASFGAHGMGKGMSKLKSMAINTRLRALCAFVTFESEEGRLRALETYKQGYCFNCCGGGGGRKFRGVTLAFEAAPSPGNVKWENLGVDWKELFIRRLLAFAFTLVLLGFSAGVIVQVKNEQKAMNLLYPPVTCPAIPPTKSEVEDEFRQNDYQPIGMIECYCQTKLDQIGTAVTSFNTTGKCEPSTQQLFRTYDSEGTCTAVNCSSVYKGQSDNCVCTREETCAQEDLCTPWLLGQLAKQSIAQGAVFLIIVVNTTLKAFMRLLVQAERMSSVNEELRSTAVRVFLASFINTACISLVLNGNAKLFTTVEIPLMQGSNPDLTVRWYRTVGAALLLTMILNIFVSHIGTWMQYPIRKIKLCLDGFKLCAWPPCTRKRSKKVTQYELYSMLVGPEWELAARYGEVLNIIFVTLMFSSFIPLLNLLAVANFIGIYTVDKIAFLRLYKTPPLYDETLAQFASTFMNGATVFHCLMGIWAYSNVDILQPDASVTTQAGAVSTDLASNPQSMVMGAIGNNNLFLTYAIPRVLFNSVGAVRVYVCFLVLVLVTLVLKGFFFFPIKKFLQKINVLKVKEAEEQDLPLYYDTLPDHILAELTEEPFLLDSLQERDVVASKVKAAISKRRAQDEAIKREQEEAKKKKKLFGRAKKVQQTKPLPTMVGMESYAMARNDKYHFMQVASGEGDDGEGAGAFEALRNMTKSGLEYEGNVLKLETEYKRKIRAKNKKERNLRRVASTEKKQAKKETKKAKKAKKKEAKAAKGRSESGAGDEVEAAGDGVTNPIADV